MNKVILVGNLTRDPELSTTSNGISYCKFSLAVQRRFSKEGEKETDFFNITAWRGQAENCHKYLKKGSKAGIVGSLQTRTYEDKDGAKKYVTDIIADEVEFLSSKTEQKETKKKVDLTPIIDDDLPF